MEFLKRFLDWRWWLLGIAVLAVFAIAIIFLNRASSPTLPPGFAEKREAVSRILDVLGKRQDVDIRPLAELEAEKDYSGAVALVERALSANALYEADVSSLAAASTELAALTVAVKSEDIIAKARQAFGLLVAFVQAEKKFYEDRRRLYEVTRQYYSDLALKKKPPVPEGLPAMVDTVNADFASAQELRRQFAGALKTFDDAVAQK